MPTAEEDTDEVMKVSEFGLLTYVALGQDSIQVRAGKSDSGRWSDGSAQLC